MVAALDSLLADSDLHARMAANAAAIQARKGTEVGADVIEKVARDYANSK
jgi:UDP:flavonoid glycosyltransferase YjiC (YdhE family)